MELGFPTEKVEAWQQYAEEPGKPTETVYAYMPLAVVAQTILDKGGFVRATWVHEKRPSRREGRKGTKRQWKRGHSTFTVDPNYRVL